MELYIYIYAVLIMSFENMTIIIYIYVTTHENSVKKYTLVNEVEMNII